MQSVGLRPPTLPKALIALGVGIGERGRCTRRGRKRTLRPACPVLCSLVAFNNNWLLRMDAWGVIR